MTERVPFPVPEHVVARARQIALALQPHVEDLVVRALTVTYREGFADGYLANPANLEDTVRLRNVRLSTERDRDMRAEQDESSLPASTDGPDPRADTTEETQ